MFSGPAMNRPAVRSRLIASASLCGRSAVTMIESLWAATWRAASTRVALTAVTVTFFSKEAQAYKCNGQTIFARSEVVDREITLSVRYGGNAFRLQLDSGTLQDAIVGIHGTPGDDALINLGWHGRGQQRARECERQQLQ